MSGITNAGTVVSISAGVPASYNQAGFEALTYTEVGEITTLGDRGRTYEDVSYNTLGERGTVHLKGSFDEPETPFEMVAARADAGQIIMKAAAASDNEYAFKVEYNNGDIDYFQGTVFSFVTGGGDSNSIRTLTSNIRVSRQGVIDVAGPVATSFTLTYTAGANGSLIGTSPQTVARGGTGSPVAAVPDATYEFVDWSDGNTDNPRQDVFIQDDLTVTANFALA